MALVTITGYPCSGKSIRAEQLRSLFQAKLKESSYTGRALEVSILSDHTLNLDRSVYNDSRAEKPARAALFTTVQRRMNSNTILIVDAPNYIKGFRYQMYCAAREMKLRVCTIYVAATQNHCMEWNAARAPAFQYSSETLLNMIARYEEPSSMVRWDSPLFTIPWTDTEKDIPIAQIWEAITSGTIKPPNSGTLSAAKAPTSALNTLENTCTSLVSGILSQSDGMGGLVTLPVPNTHTLVKVVLPARTITVSEMQRHKRQFVNIHKKAITLGTTESGPVDWSAESVAQRFVTYLEENIKS
ncbi:chromatin associated protein KTI12 [Fistulina hepatica ATCC 64428]|nr:chromatin associated protein KTI12 [Fistulina hepatica ATCC 64428]